MMKVLPKLLLLLLAVLAVRMAGRALKRDADVMSALWVLVAMTANASVTAGPKSRSTEQRLNSLIPVVFPKTGGTISGNVTVNGTHTVNGNMSVSGSHTVGGQVNAGTLSVGGAATSYGFTSHGQIAADGNMYVGGSLGGSGGGTVELTSHLHSPGNVQADGTMYATSFSGSSGHVSGDFQADGNLRASNFSGSFHGGQGAVSTVSAAPGTYSSSYETSLASAINGIISRLNSSGVT